MTEQARRRATDNLEHPHTPYDACPGGCEDIKAVEQRLNDGHLRMDRIESKLDATCAEISEVLDIIRTGKSFFKAIGYFGSFVKWCMVIGAPIVTFYFALKNGGK